MAKVITFSRRYPAYHPKIGVLTNFPEKFLKSWCLNPSTNESIELPNIDFDLSVFDNCKPKGHTIRAGKRFKAGDYFSPRIWYGQPYRTPQVILAPDTKIQKVWNIEIHSTMEIYINGKYFSKFWNQGARLLAQNDGLNHDDFKSWFTLDPAFKRTGKFSGQIICWDKNIEYI